MGAARGNGVSVSVVVPVKERREQMQRCLDALLAQEGVASYEVLVLDDFSRDGTAGACRARAASAGAGDGARTAGDEAPPAADGARVRVEQAEGLPGARRNIGARLAAAPVVAYTDSDCLPEPGWLAAGLAALERDPGLGLVTGRTLPEAGVQLGAWVATQEVTGPSRYFETCNAFYRRDALLEAGGFAEDVDMWEDTVGGWNVVRAGWSHAYAPEAVVHHEVSHPGLRWWLRRARRYGQVADVVRACPELRDEALWGRWFLRPRSAAFAAAAVGIALAPATRGRSLAAAAPYAWMRRPRFANPQAVLDQAEVALFDAAIFASMVRGSARARRLVL